MSGLHSVFRLVGLEPNPVSASQRKAVEERLGRLPEAFAELVFTDAWPELLRLGSDDHPLELERLGEPIVGYGDVYSGVEEGLLTFMYENQGVCTWSIPLQAGPDPEVFVEVGTMPRPAWSMACESFSAWLRARVDDGLMSQRMTFAAQAPPLSAAMLKALQDAFVEGPRTYVWPGKTNYRFRGSEADILLWDAEGQCDWFVAPRSDATLALRAIPRINEVADAFYPLTGDGELALAALRTKR